MVTLKCEYNLQKNKNIIEKEGFRYGTLYTERLCAQGITTQFSLHQYVDRIILYE